MQAKLPASVIFSIILAHISKSNQITNALDHWLRARVKGGLLKIRCLLDVALTVKLWHTG